MLFFSILLFLLSPVVFAWDHHHQHCLTDDAATAIINKYYSIWSTRDPAVFTQLVNDLVTDNFTREDETINFGVGPCVLPPEGPYAPNKAAFIATLMARLAESTIADETYETLWMVHDCESIAFRWRGSAVAIGSNANFTALPGDPVRWKGIDMLQVDVGQMKLTKAVSSADWFWYEYYIGAKIVYQKYHFPACLCQDPVPGINSKGECSANGS